LKAKKKLKEYLTKGVRKIKNRKGFGVHSPFAYSIITEVIEEKTAYYSYFQMKKIYGKEAAISFKTACLLFRLANRFRCRKILELKCDGGYTLAPLLLVDSRNEIASLGASDDALSTHSKLWIVGERKGHLTYINTLNELPDGYKADMFVLNMRPDGMTDDQFFSWLLRHADERSIFFFKGIRPGGELEGLWDLFCDSDDISITMDMYNYGLAICRPRFFKQHYIVSF